jgi:hypothetical protein
MIVNYYLLFSLLALRNVNLTSCFIRHLGCNSNRNHLQLNSYRKTYHFSQRYTEELLKRIQSNNGNYTGNEYELLLKKLNSKNGTIQNSAILGEFTENFNKNKTNEQIPSPPRVRIIINKNALTKIT